MSTEQWLLLTDYSSKYRVSVSTLRRRIKNNQIPFRFEGGKYFLIDASPNHPEVTAHEKTTPFFEELKTLAVEAAPLKTPVSETGSFNEFSDQLDSDLGLPRRQEVFEIEDEPLYVDEIIKVASAQQIARMPNDQVYCGNYNETPDVKLQASAEAEPLMTTATNLLNELKRAYSNILLEKEEQMIQLKKEVSDLKTLVRVLEDENDRGRRQINEYHRSFEIARRRELE